MNEETTTQNEAPAHKYFTTMLNMAEDELDPFQYRLLAHYVRWAGDGKPFPESIRATAKSTKMGVNKVQSSLIELSKLKYLKVDRPTQEEARNGKTISITVLDRWLENISRFKKPVSESIQPVSNPIQTCIENDTPPVSNPIRSEEQNTDRTKNKELVAANAEPAKTINADITITPIQSKTDLVEKLKTPRPKKVPTEKPERPVFDAIKEVWGIISPGYCGSMESMMRGTAKKKDKWGECSFDPPAYPDEIRAFGVYAHNRMATNGIRNLPTQPETIQRWFYDFRTERDGKAKQTAQPITTIDWSEWEVHTFNPEALGL